MAEGNPRCAHCGRAVNSSKPSVREIVIDSVSALLLLAILVPLGWQINKAAERLFHRFVQHLLRQGVARRARPVKFKKEAPSSPFRYG
jgi:hypothetical protein